MKLKHALLVPAILGLVAYGGAKAYLYFQVKDRMDNLVRMASPFVDLSYQGISTDLGGELGVSGVRIIPRGAPLSIDIGSISLRGDGPGFLYELMGSSDMREPPGQMSLAVRGFRLPADPELVKQINPALAQLAPEPCSLGGIMQHAALAEIGIGEIVADSHLGYRLNKKSGELRFRFSYHLEGIESTSFEAELNNVTSPGAMAMGALPNLRRLSMTYSPVPEYVNKVVGHCARQADQPVEAFVDGMLAGDDDTLASQLGFVPGLGIKQALREMLLEPGELLLTATPDSYVDPVSLANYKPTDMVALLNLGLSVKGKPVSDLSFEIPNLQQLAARLRGEPVPQQVEEKARPKRPPAIFIATPKNALGSYIGRDVRLHMREGKNEREPKQGVLIALRQGVMDVEQRLFGGKMTVHIPMDAVERVEVLRRPESN